MRRYFALVHKDINSAFGVQFPDIPGVFSAADEEADILTNAIEALQLYFEDQTEYEVPSSLDQLLAHDDIRKELAAGAFFVRVPLVENNTEVVRTNVTFERGLLNAIDATAKARGLNRSAFLATAALHEMEA